MEIEVIVTSVISIAAAGVGATAGLVLKRHYDLKDKKRVHDIAKQAVSDNRLENILGEIKDLTKYLLRSIKRYKLDKGDKEAYIRLRERYNSTTESHRDPKMLYLILLYGFRQQLRFNSSYEFNNPVGNSSFNEPTFEKLVSFCRRLQEQNILFLAYDFEKLSEYIDRDTFVYCDPPYLITLGSYNDGKRGFNGWDASDEVRLYNFLDNLNARGVKFMMSNVLEHKGLQNSLLADWVKDRGYNILNNTGVGGRGRKEILITNYQKSIL